MAIKNIRKDKLHINKGYVMDDKGRVVNLPSKIYQQANDLETNYQKWMYLKDQPEATLAPSLDGFKRRNVCDIEVPHVVANTPTIDKRIEEAMAFAKEADDAYIAEKANAVFGYLANLIDFVNSETVFVNYEYDEPLMFNTPVLGNPLEWDEDYITNAVMTTCDVTED